ncbi:hypothetical protein NDU88_011043 [Pleurodeles waltl]|uniref:Uncharacterized protein n=1 Tax=Pleurodeles waltl TaxID=8319 RepID=A0AAV7Q3Y1_PLEWA|nr:hypothetical protein NDU88_011043 [Pleurodeles waltl]
MERQSPGSHRTGPSRPSQRQKHRAQQWYNSPHVSFASLAGSVAGSQNSPPKGPRARSSQRSRPQQARPGPPTLGKLSRHVASSPLTGSTSPALLNGATPAATSEAPLRQLTAGVQSASALQGRSAPTGLRRLDSCAGPPSPPAPQPTCLGPQEPPDRRLQKIVESRGPIKPLIRPRDQPPATSPQQRHTRQRLTPPPAHQPGPGSPRPGATRRPIPPGQASTAAAGSTCTSAVPPGPKNKDVTALPG